ncbi:hypothetical protein [Janibacter melonis]|uniref:hypothetical protein n=1 Tax=Janibacter melonis TaxID=262209 RepID=UPI002095F0B1|nr:hypothetical protein [Janibacter melonis]
MTYTYQKALWVPAETPKAVVDLMRTSSEALAQDKDFEEAADKVLGGYPLDAGADLATRIREAYTVDASVREHVITLLSSSYNVTVE